MKTGCKKIITALLLTAVLLFQCMLPAFAQVSQSVRFQIAPITAQKGDIITVPVRISSNAAIHLGGIAFYIEYKENCLSYIEESGVSAVPQMNGAIIYNNAGARRVSFVWTSGEIVTLSTDTVLCRLQFRVLDSAVSEADVTLNISEVYTFVSNGGAQTAEDFIVEQNTVNGDITIQGADGAVAGVIQKINAIGTVTYTPECLQKIVDAAAAYSILSVLQQQQVTNYDVLTAAQVEYDRLRIQAEQSAVSSEISAYLNAHKDALALTVNTVKIADEPKVLAAFNAFNKLSKNAQYKIFSYNTSLKNLRAKIADLKEAEKQNAAAKAEEERLREEAQEYAKIFREEKKAFLSMQVKDLIAAHYTGLNDAMENLNMLCELNPYVAEYLKSEQLILSALLTAVQDIIKNSSKNEISSEQMEADIFRNNFSYILAQTAATITADDALDVRLAYSIYEMLDPAVQALLTKEYDLLSGLLLRVEELALLPGEDDSPVEPADPDQPDAPDNNQNTRPAGIGNVTMRFANRKMGAVVWILLLLAALALLVFSALQVFYHCYFKKKGLSDPGAAPVGEVVKI